MSLEALVVLATFPDVATARRIGQAVVEDGLAACVSLLPGVESIYRWQGQVEKSAEVLAMMKTTASGYDRLEARLRELHPYDTPEILAIPVERGSAKYLAWLNEAVAPPP